MKRFWDWLAPISVLLILVGALILSGPYSEAQELNVKLETVVTLSGRLENQKGVINYWAVTFYGVDAAGNYQGWTEEVQLPGGSTVLQASVVAREQFVQKLNDGDEQALGFLNAVSNGQLQELKL